MTQIKSTRYSRVSTLVNSYLDQLKADEETVEFTNNFLKEGIEAFYGSGAGEDVIAAAITYYAGRECDQDDIFQYSFESLEPEVPESSVKNGFRAVRNSLSD